MAPRLLALPPMTSMTHTRKVAETGSAEFGSMNLM